MEIKVTNQKSLGFYVRAFKSFLDGREAREATTDEPAQPALDPVDRMRISALGEAINVAGALAARIEADGIGDIVGVDTKYPEMPNGRACAQIVIHVTRKGLHEAAPRLTKYRSFPSKFVAPRAVHVWLPESYDTDSEPYAVLYMHDGQNLFEKSMSAFGTTWEAATALSQLMQDGAVRKTLIVGIFNGEVTRFREYVPDDVVERLDGETRETLLKQAVYGGEPLSPGYVNFVVKELKPFIDKNYRTKPERENTFIMGSSMGGLISWYTLSLHPDTFAAAGCVSTHWPLTIDQATLDNEAAGWQEAVSAAHRCYLKESIPAAGTHRFWFDYGSEELDAHYEPYQKMVDSIFADKGYVQGEDVVTKSYPGASHNEASWRDRLKEVLTYLLHE